MAWVNFRTTLDRFSHIDAQFVRGTASLTPAGGEAEIVVRFYPWWEHPLYIRARDHGGHWAFSSYKSGVREVTVRAIRPWSVRLSARSDVIDWDFAEQHPLLWTYSEQVTIYVNEPFELSALLDELLALKLPNVSRGDLLQHVAVESGSVPRGLTIPAELYDPTLRVFRKLGVATFAPHAPRAPKPGVVFLLDDSDYIIADDFEIDVPEFIHEPSWFQASGSDAG
jgi:hypothetical protein